MADERTLIYVRVHIECDFRNDQNDDDWLSLYVHGTDGYYLNDAEIRELRDRLDTALRIQEAAKSEMSA